VTPGRHGKYLQPESYPFSNFWGNQLTDQEAEATSSRSTFALWIGTAAILVVLDQITKLAIIKWVPLYERIPVNGFINITHQQNSGAAFSFLADAGGWQRWAFIALATGVSAFIAHWLWRIRSERLFVLSAGLAFVLGGAVGNLVDRIRLGYVVDFIQVWLGKWPFPSFNVADAAITVGAALLIIDALFISGRQEKQPV
jgi:signal peptidase II